MFSTQALSVIAFAASGAFVSILLALHWWVTLKRTTRIYERFIDRQLEKLVTAVAYLKVASQLTERIACDDFPEESDESAHTMEHDRCDCNEQEETPPGPVAPLPLRVRSHRQHRSPGGESRPRDGGGTFASR